MNQVVIVTGAASGLGLSLAERFVNADARVYGATKSKRHWKDARRRISNAQSFSLDQLDLSRELNVRRFIAKIFKKEGRIDIVINNAGYAGRPKTIEKEGLKELEKHLTDNLITTFLMSKYTIPVFRNQKRGWLINIASMAGKRAVPRLGSYSASKFGVLALTQSIAKENLNVGFRAVTVCPGGMNTEMRSRLFGTADAARQQSPDFVADKILEILDGKIHVSSGGDVVIRHSQVTEINEPPEA